MCKADTYAHYYILYMSQFIADTETGLVVFESSIESSKPSMQI